MEEDWDKMEHIGSLCGRWYVSRIEFDNTFYLQKNSNVHNQHHTEAGRANVGDDKMLGVVIFLREDERAGFLCVG